MSARQQKENVAELPREDLLMGFAAPISKDDGVPHKRVLEYTQMRGRGEGQSCHGLQADSWMVGVTKDWHV